MDFMEKGNLGEIQEKKSGQHSPKLRAMQREYIRNPEHLQTLQLHLSYTRSTDLWIDRLKRIYWDKI
ncbi:hypothetical protein NECAME_10032 [Necator americanus]|uniref:Uncharacterized protein n=1 Tax=Necator americanus TaxID=51031 RepID=W2TAM5_NECAM|nr:hypothetical protein NECAME_10032 [Necator americanus]ETN79085.1 hypothetical protein NECAME_10032 [Necator americanus]